MWLTRYLPYKNICISVEKESAPSSSHCSNKRMKLASDRNFLNPVVGDSVRIQVPDDVDRGKTFMHKVFRSASWKLGTTMTFSNKVHQTVFRNRCTSLRIKFTMMKNIPCIRNVKCFICLLYTSPSPRDRTRSRMPSSA